MNEGRQAIRTYGRIHGRITRGQRQAIEKWGPRYLIPCDNGRLDDRGGFLKRRPLALDLGCGMCDALVDIAQGRPDCNFIGIDVYEPGIARGCYLLAQAQLDNVRLVRHDMLAVLDKGLEPGCVDEVYVLFPDPWPKKRHHKRRLVKDDFLSALYRIMRPSAPCILATDWDEYADGIEDAFAARKDFAADDIAQARDIIEATKFSRRSQAEGRTIRALCYRKA